MKVRFVLENDYGYSHDVSVEVNVDVVPKVGEWVRIDTRPLLERVFSVENLVYFCGDININDVDLLAVCEVYHDYTKINHEIYVVLVKEYDVYVNDKYGGRSLSRNSYYKIVEQLNKGGQNYE